MADAHDRKKSRFPLVCSSSDGPAGELKGAGFYPAWRELLYISLGDALDALGVKREAVLGLCAKVVEADDDLALLIEADDGRCFVVVGETDDSIGIYRPFLSPLCDTIERAKGRARELHSEFRCAREWVICCL